MIERKCRVALYTYCLHETDQRAIVCPSPVHSYRNTEIDLHHILYKLLYVSYVAYVRIRCHFGSSIIILEADC